MLPQQRVIDAGTVTALRRMLKRREHSPIRTIFPELREQLHAILAQMGAMPDAVKL